MADEKRPVIIKHIKKASHAHHGGAWKIAYADFVTAMMAFFLLLWLLNAVTEQQLKGISEYFAPLSASRTDGGSGLTHGGTDMTSSSGSLGARSSIGPISAPPPTIGEADGEDKSTAAPTDPTLVAKSPGTDGVDRGMGPGDTQVKPEPTPEPETQDGQKAQPAEPPVKVVQQTTPRDITEAQLKEALARQEQDRFQKAKEALERAMVSIPEMQKFRGNLLVDNTEEGLRIQLLDQAGLSMFPSGQSSMYGHTRSMLELVARIINQMPASQKISISGHTDATPFADKRYTNWELSLERALAARRVLMMAGVTESRIDRVVGRADQDPIVPEDRFAPQNRRISIVLLREGQPQQR